MVIYLPIYFFKITMSEKYYLFFFKRLFANLFLAVYYDFLGRLKRTFGSECIYYNYEKSDLSYTAYLPDKSMTTSMTTLLQNYSIYTIWTHTHNVMVPTIVGRCLYLWP